MLKKIARYILRNEIQIREDSYDRMVQEVVKTTFQNDRLEEIVNKREEKTREVREYTFSPESMTSEESKIIGDYAGSPLIGLVTKWFKTRADQNNDLLIHSVDASKEKQALWRIAVLVYEDWYMFIKNCKQISDKVEVKKEKEEIKAKKTK